MDLWPTPSAPSAVTQRSLSTLNLRGKNVTSCEMLPSPDVQLRDPVRLRRPNIVRRIAEHTDSRLRPCKSSRLLHSSPEDIASELISIAELTKDKMLEQSAMTQLEPANPLKIPCSYSEDGASRPQMEQYGFHRRKDGSTEVSNTLLNKAAHESLCFPQSWPPRVVRNLRQQQGIAKNAHIRVSVRDNTFQIHRPSSQRSQRLAEGEEVNCIGAMQQSTVDVE